MYTVAADTLVGNIAADMLADIPADTPVDKQFGGNRQDKSTAVAVGKPAEDTNMPAGDNHIPAGDNHIPAEADNHIPAEADNHIPRTQDEWDGYHEYQCAETLREDRLSIPE
jgi:hypothetical protein